MHDAPTPKMLPWLARKSGVPLPRAETLWHKAECFANRISRPGTPAWSKVAVAHLRTALAAESRKRPQIADIGALWLLPARLWLVTAGAWERTALALTVARRSQQRPC